MSVLHNRFFIFSFSLILSHMPSFFPCLSLSLSFYYGINKVSHLLSICIIMKQWSICLSLFFFISPCRFSINKQYRVTLLFFLLLVFLCFSFPPNESSRMISVGFFVFLSFSLASLLLFFRPYTRVTMKFVYNCQFSFFLFLFLLRSCFLLSSSNFYLRTLISRGTTD